MSYYVKVAWSCLTNVNSIMSTHREFYRVEDEQAPASVASHHATSSSISPDAHALQLCQHIRQNIIGAHHDFASPFGRRRITYCDYTASGRSLQFIEDYIQQHVLPTYGNTHTTTSMCGQQTTLLRAEARQIIAQSVHCGKDDVVLFAGSGSTSAIMLLVRTLNISKLDRPVVFVGPHEHHSNLLPWRESGAEVVTIREDPVSGCVDIQHLAEQLDHFAGRFLIGSFCAASNLTGVMSDVDQITLLLHQKGALAFFDYAAAAPHVEIDMNPSRHLHSHLYSKDAIFISAHKFVGGVGSPGILVVKKKLLQNAVPAAPGGGTVFFVTENSHLYLQNLEERNEGGTPDIVGSIRAGLAFQLKHAVDVAWIKRKEIELSQKAWRSMSHNSNIVLFGPSPFVAERLPIFSFLIRFHDGSASQNRFLHYQYVCALLNDLFGIQTRGGCVCAGPYGQRLLGIDEHLSQQFESALLQKYELVRPGFTRFNLAYFQSDEEVDFVLKAIDFVATHGWKLMPAYAFHEDTGEWKHRSRLSKLPGRIWLSHISYRSGQFGFNSTDHSPSTANPASLASYLDLAEHILASALKSKHDLVDQSQFLSAQQLRWFALPSEAAALLKHPNLMSSPVSDQNSNMLPFSFLCEQSHAVPAYVHATIPEEPVMESKPEQVVATGSETVPAAEPIVAAPAAEESSFNDDEPVMACPLRKPGSGDAVCTPCEAAYQRAIARFDQQSSGKQSSDDSNPTSNEVKLPRAVRPPVQSKPQKQSQSSASKTEKGMLVRNGKVVFTAEQTAAHRLRLQALKDNAAAARASKAKIDAEVVAIDEVNDIGSFETLETSVPEPVSTLSDLNTANSNICAHCFHAHADVAECVSCNCITFVPLSSSGPSFFNGNNATGMAPVSGQLLSRSETHRAQLAMCKLVGRAIRTFSMIQEGDRVLVALSGGKDSLSMLHVLRLLQERSPVKFEIGAATVDPQTPEYNPRPLIAYLASINVPYYYLSQAIIEQAKISMDPRKVSICAFCARMKRGMLYSCARQHGYNVLAMGQHADDLAESLFMSIFHNGALRTMKANYHVAAGDLRVIRPLVFVRERQCREFARAMQFPVIHENCPACFSQPKERARIKSMLAAQEHIFPQLNGNIMRAMMPLVRAENNAYEAGHGQDDDDE